MSGTTKFYKLKKKNSFAEDRICLFSNTDTEDRPFSQIMVHVPLTNSINNSHLLYNARGNENRETCYCQGKRKAYRVWLYPNRFITKAKYE